MPDPSPTLAEKQNVPPRRLSSGLVIVVVGGLIASFVGFGAELYWRSLNNYEQSTLLNQTVGRRQITWDFRNTRAAESLGKPPSILTGSSGPMYCWEGPCDIRILLPDGRELLTDTLLITADIENGQVVSIQMQGGTQLTRAEVLGKFREEARLMRPNMNSDGTSAEMSAERWLAGSPGISWVVRDRPEIHASVRDMGGGRYLFEYELSWY